MSAGSEHTIDGLRFEGEVMRSVVSLTDIGPDWESNLYGDSAQPHKSEHASDCATVNHKNITKIYMYIVPI